MSIRSSRVSRDFAGLKKMTKEIIRTPNAKKIKYRFGGRLASSRDKMNEPPLPVASTNQPMMYKVSKNLNPPVPIFRITRT